MKFHLAFKTFHVFLSKHAQINWPKFILSYSLPEFIKKRHSVNDAITARSTMSEITKILKIFNPIQT